MKSQYVRGLVRGASSFRSVHGRVAQMTSSGFHEPASRWRDWLGRVRKSAKANMRGRMSNRAVRDGPIAGVWMPESP